MNKFKFEFDPPISEELQESNHFIKMVANAEWEVTDWEPSIDEVTNDSLILEYIDKKRKYFINNMAFVEDKKIERKIKKLIREYKKNYKGE